MRHEALYLNDIVEAADHIAAWQEPISRRFTKRIQADILRPKVFYVCKNPEIAFLNGRA